MKPFISTLSFILIGAVCFFGASDLNAQSGDYSKTNNTINGPSGPVIENLAGKQNGSSDIVKGKDEAVEEMGTHSSDEGRELDYDPDNPGPVIENLAGKTTEESDILVIKDLGMNDGKPKVDNNAEDNDENPKEEIISIDLKEVVQLFPNPTKDILNIRFQFEMDASLEITNLMGQRLFKQDYTEADRIQLDMDNYGSGIYMVVLNVGDQREVFKVQVQ